MSLIKVIIVSSVIMLLPYLNLLADADTAKELREMGFKAASEGKYDEAIKLYRKILTDYPKSEYADDAQWGIIFLLDDPNARYEECQKLLERYPTSEWADDAMRAMANIAFDHKRDYQKAIELGRRFIRRYPKSQFAFEQRFQIAWSYKYLNNYEVAIKEAKKLISEYPQHRDTPGLYIFIGSTYWQDMRDLEAAKKVFKEALEKYPYAPTSFTALTYLGSIYIEEGKKEAQQELYRTFLKEHPNHNKAKEIEKLLKPLENSSTR